jgi:hypothetical protein
VKKTAGSSLLAAGKVQGPNSDRTIQWILIPIGVFHSTRLDLRHLPSRASQQKCGSNVRKAVFLESTSDSGNDDGKSRCECSEDNAAINREHIFQTNTASLVRFAQMV